MLMFSQTVRLAVARPLRHRHAAQHRLACGLFVMAPLLWWIALNSHTLVQLLFVRGEFYRASTRQKSGRVARATPSVVFLGVNQLLSNAFYAMDRVKVPALVMPFGTLVYIAAAVPLSEWLGTQGLAVATTTAAMTVFAALLIAMARQVPEIGLVRTICQLAFYAVLGGTAMLAATSLLGRLALTPTAVAAAALPLGATAYAAALFFGGDRTFRALLELARVYAAHALPLSGYRNRSSKAPPARKTD
jgi:putative peptidoglycan lipid II flippase